jgi:hypothetical protein
MIISAQIISLHRTWFVHHPHHLTPYPPSHTDLIVYRYTIRPCAQIAFTLGENATMAVYPQCVDYFNGQIPNLPVIVTADFASENSMEVSATLGIPFGAAGWLALLIHTFAIECYVSPTPLLSTPVSTSNW